MLLTFGVRLCYTYPMKTKKDKIIKLYTTLELRPPSYAKIATRLRVSKSLVAKYVTEWKKAQKGKFKH